MRPRVGRWIPVFGFFLMAVCFLTGLIWIRSWEQADTGASDEESNLQQIFYQDAWYQYKDGLETVLLIGIDKFVQEDGPVHGEYEQADFLMLLVIDKKQETCSILYLDRDTMVDYEVLDDFGQYAGMSYGQLALSHAYGDTSDMRNRNTARAVSRLLCGVPVDEYVSLTMDGIGVLTDFVGGVPVYVEDDFSAVSETLVQGETVVLTGDTALTFVRTRREVGDGSNRARMRRQAAYLSSLWERVQSLDWNSSFQMAAFDDLSPYMESSCSIQTMASLLEMVLSYEIIEIVTPVGNMNYEEQFAEFFPDDTALQDMVISVFYEKIEG